MDGSHREPSICLFKIVHARQVLRDRSVRTRYVTVLPHIFWIGAAISEVFKKCWDTKIFPPLKSMRMSPRSGCARSIKKLTHAHNPSIWLLREWRKRIFYLQFLPLKMTINNLKFPFFFGTLIAEFLFFEEDKM